MMTTKLLQMVSAKHLVTSSKLLEFLSNFMYLWYYISTCHQSDPIALRCKLNDCFAHWENWRYHFSNILMSPGPLAFLNYALSFPLYFIRHLVIMMLFQIFLVGCSHSFSESLVNQSALKYTVIFWRWWTLYLLTTGQST